MTTDAVGGVFTYALALMSALEADCSFHVANLGPPPDVAQRRWLARLPNVTLHTRTLKLEWMESPWADVAEASVWLRSLESAVRPDVVHLNGYVNATAGFRAPVLVVSHSCVCSWWEAVHRGEPPVSLDRYRREVRRGLEAAGLVVAPSRAMLEALGRHHGEPRRTRVIPNALPPGPWAPGPKEPLVLGVGRLWDEAKNLATLERAAAKIPWPVVVAGAPPARGQGVVERLGRLEPHTLAGWYARAAVFAHPARYEPFGLAVLEAARSGCALVLGDIPSLRENWDGCADFVPPDGPEALARSLTSLLSDPERRARLASAAHARSLHFSLERFGRGYLEAYAQLRHRARP